MSGNQEAFQKAINLGHSAAWDQQWEQAAAYYRKALAELPGNPAALTSLGLALFELQRFDEALQIYRQSAQAATGDPIPLEKIARIYERQGKLAEAVQASLQAAELQLKAQEVQKAIGNWITVLNWQPENLLARSRLGMVYDRTGHKPEAVREYLAAASVLQHSGDTAKALQLADYALKIMPDNPDARKAVAAIKSSQLLSPPGKPKPVTGPIPSQQGARKKEPSKKGTAASLDPVGEARQKAVVQLAAVLFDQADESPISPPAARRGISALARSLSGYAEDSSDRTRIMLHLSQAIESLSNAQDSQAAAELERAQEAGLNHPACHFILGLLVNHQDHQKALRALQNSVKHPDFALASYLLIGQDYEDQDLLQDAASAYLQALRLADLECVAKEQYEQLDQIYETLLENQTHQVEAAALKNICETISGQLLRPDWRAYLQVARQQLPGQQAGGSPVPLADMLLESRSSQVVEVLSKVRQLSDQGKYRSAMEEAFYAIQFAPTYLPLHIQIGELLLKEEHTQSAISKFLLVANMYTLRGEAAQAVRLLSRAMEMTPMDMTIRTALIDLLTAQGRMDEALQQYMALGDFYYQMADLDKAHEAYLGALRLPQAVRANRATSIQILQKAADIDLQRLDMRQALSVFEQIRSLQPEDSQTRMNLVNLNLRLGQDEAALTETDNFISYLEGQKRPEKAAEFLEGIIKERADRLDFRKRLSDVYLRMGQIPKAVEQLDAIADGLMVNKNKTAAINVLETIISLNPPNSADYRAALAQLRS